ncbi:protein kinase [Nocardia sp. NPDC006044]|uniref:serine/threonine-protein kinase n=1 Tax=Nocardia sp. NPDC006044 TaxID=3364306 RepID=UPI0036CB3F21
MRPLGADDPARIGDYRILGVLGAGGMGRVYLGRNAGGRTVAVKVIRPELVGDNEFRERFRREVTAARRVGGQFTAPVLDADVDADPPWLATGYVAGFSLTEAVGEYGPFAENSLLVLAHGLAEALVAVHAAGLVHRDLKPSNVLLALDGPKVIDFGIARAIDDSQFTTTGKVIGSPGFMCPEQVTGDPVGPASDVFALGGVLVFAATGQGPFGIGAMVQMLWRVVYEEPRLDAVPDRLRPLIAACLAKDPAARPTPERIIADLTALGLPGRGGWLPAPALEEVSRRAVQLLDLDSGPFDVPDALSKQPNPTRTAETVVRPVTDPNARPVTNANARPVTDPNARPVTDPNARTATSMPASGQPDVTPRSWWRGAPDGSNPSPYAPAAPQDRSHTPQRAHRYVAPQNASYSAPPPQDGPYSASGAQPPRRRIALIAGGLVLCLVIAIAAFVITKQFTDSDRTTDQSTSTPGSAAAELPEAFVGEWKGVAKDKIAGFDIVLTLNAGTVGEELGTSSNTGKVVGMTCGRAETLTAVDGEELTLTARLTEDSGGCNDDGNTTHLQLLPDGTLSYRTASVIGDMSGILSKTS